ncbi:NAD(P)-dependent oxidoreductase [Agromyces sp. Soil535]|uniref:NAD-dependent epimerase/dehydratase family protein n=1 Tax=Agromyces sp. Soil535 TaxID=1736390 RepID=UPI0006FA16AA|nr:NAD(P)-dependent oxidoreductase [Agromyces sp. Soil535]KRE22876.1 NAD-dependent dehydratase [Agromyces sp. Soil535]
MKVLIAGATGTLGMPIVRQLIDAGHAVVGISRTAEGAERLRRVGASAIVADVMDRDRLLRAADGVEADAVLHELTALKKAPAGHGAMAATDALRVEGTTNLLDVAREVGAGRFVTQSIVLGYGYADHGDEVITEESPFGRTDGSRFDAHVDAMVSTEQQAFHADGIDGIALRYGVLYGEDADTVERMLRRRSLPVPRHGGELAFVHHQDAAAATVAALDRGRAGEAYNIVDDTPATFRDLITSIAGARDAPEPLVLPGWLLKLVAPYGGVVLGDVSMRVSNAKAKRELAWMPRFPSYRDGVAALGGDEGAAP